jgi:transposase
MVHGFVHARQSQVRLTSAQADELVARYRAGASQHELSAAYGVHAKTVSAIVTRLGRTRQRGLSDEQIERAGEHYSAGDSAALIGKRFGVAATTIRARLVERGVTMRDTHGRAKG